MTKEEITIIEKEANELLSNLEVSAKSTAEFNEENGTVNVQIDSEEAAALIGFHGETLQSIQMILSFMVHKSLGNWVKVIVNIGDYRQKREEQLNRLALSLAMKVKFSGEAQAIQNLTPSERRIVHLALADNPDVSTESEGEGRERQLIIRPKSSH